MTGNWVIYFLQMDSSTLITHLERCGNIQPETYTMDQSIILKKINYLKSTIVVHEIDKLNCINKK